MTLMNIIATDPVTGAVLSGITITDNEGDALPVNVSSATASVPEPGAVPLLAASLSVLALLGGTKRVRKYRQSID